MEYKNEEISQVLMFLIQPLFNTLAYLFLVFYFSIVATSLTFYVHVNEFSGGQQNIAFRCKL